jgi:hypothetical protein
LVSKFALLVRVVSPEASMSPYFRAFLVFAAGIVGAIVLLAYLTQVPS